MGLFDFLKKKKIENIIGNEDSENIYVVQDVVADMEVQRVTEKYEAPQGSGELETNFRETEEIQIDKVIEAENKAENLTEKAERSVKEFEEKKVEVLDKEKPEIESSENSLENIEDAEEKFLDKEEGQDGQGLEQESVDFEKEGQEEQKQESQEQENQEQKEQLRETLSEEVKKSFVKKIFSGLEKTRKNILSNVENVLKAFRKIDEEMFEALEEALILADIGTETSTQIIEAVKERVKREKITEVSEVKKLLYSEIAGILEDGNEEFILNKPAVILVIGVNGVGKTTTIGKLASNYKKSGFKVLLAAADTFRAAAIDQLEIWGGRSGIDTIKHQENSDPGAVVFDAIAAAKARKVDLLICDTAGRLHNKKNLMDELKKIFKIISQNYQEAQLEVLLVLDSTTGQNALQQAKVFKEVANITGIVLTKLDGTAKGGIVIAIKNELNIPVRFVGMGEGIEDLQRFNPQQFAKALFSEKAE